LNVSRKTIYNNLLRMQKNDTIDAWGKMLIW
jgi:hypothetical protein